MSFIEMKNAQNLGYTLGENEFADMTEEQMRERNGTISEDDFLAFYKDAT